MTEEKTKQSKTTFGQVDDPGFLVAKGRFYGADDERKEAEKTHVHKLSSAIFMALSNHGYAKIRAVGARAVYNANKAIAEASSHCAPKGIELVWKVAFDEGNIGELRDPSHVSNVTAMVFDVRDYKDWAQPEAATS